MAFDVTNTLETTPTNNGDIDWYDGGGTIQGTLVAHTGTTGGFWYVNPDPPGTTPSGSTGCDAVGASGALGSFTYTEMSGSPAGFEFVGVWTTQYDNNNQALYVEIDHHLYCLSGSTLTIEYSTLASPDPTDNADWTVIATAIADGTDPGWDTLQADLSAIAKSTTVSIRIRYLSVSNNYANDCCLNNWRIYSVDLVEVEQEGYRFYDDGTESGSSARQAQDTVDSIVREITFQLRVLLNADGDPATQQYQLEYKEAGDPAAEWRKVPLT